MNNTAREAGDTTRSYSLDGHRISVRPLAPGLYLVATPIGNLGDVTLRALATLAAADVVACEDTRVTSVLLRRFGIRAKLVSYHDHNAARQRPRLLSALADGGTIALVSDAGTPLVSDPGYRLAVEARAAGHTVFPIPGASAVLAGLVASGLPSDAFMFAGFLPPKSGPRSRRLAALAAVPATLIFFESPQRLAASLADMAAALGERPAAIARELTKAFETVRRGTLAELAAALANEAPPKGEVVVVVGPPLAAATSEAEADELLKSLLETHSVSAAAAEAAAITSLPRREMYARALALKSRRSRQ